MKKDLKQRLEAAGWAVGGPRELLGLTDAEDALVDAKLHLADAVRELRTRRGWSQSELAKLMGSSQPRVAKIENKDREVSLELQMRAVFAARPESRREFAGLVRRWSGHRRGQKMSKLEDLSTLAATNVVRPGSRPR